MGEHRTHHPSILTDTRGAAVGAGRGGDIDIEAPQVALTDGAQIASFSRGLGRGGDVRLTITETLMLMGTALPNEGSLAVGSPSGIFTSSEGADDSGGIDIEV